MLFLYEPNVICSQSGKKKHKKSDTKSEEKLPSFKVEQIYSLLLGFVLNKKGKALINMFNL